MTTVSIICILIIITSIISLIQSVSQNNKRMKLLNEWSQFNTQLIDWGKEIQDPNIRGEYIEFSLGFILNSYNPDDAIERVKEIPKYMEEIEFKYIEHIPSLKQNKRDIKLKTILYGNR